MTTADRITASPDVMQGKPVIKGTRIPVDLLLRKLAEGASEADLLDAYPHLTVDDIRAALAYAAESVSHETVLFTETTGGGPSA
jgi:uncharacterized protein (DUF433 family)